MYLFYASQTFDPFQLISSHIILQTNTNTTSLDQVEKKVFFSSSYVYLIMNIGERQSIMQHDRKLSISAIRRQNIVKFMNHKDRHFSSE